MFEKSVYILLAIWSHSQITKCWNPCLSKCTNVQEVIVWMRCVWGAHGRGEGTFISHSSGSETNTAAHTNLQKLFFPLVNLSTGRHCAGLSFSASFWYQRQGHLVEKSEPARKEAKRSPDGEMELKSTLEHCSIVKWDCDSVLINLMRLYIATQTDSGVGKELNFLTWVKVTVQEQQPCLNKCENVKLRLIKEKHKSIHFQKRFITKK